jgi:hypothetical protein
MQRVAQLPRVGALLLILLGCEKTAPKDTPVRAAVGEQEAIVKVAASPIDTTLTLGDWLRMNASDSVSLGFTSNPEQETICRVAIGKSNLSGHTVVRFALFNAAPPADEALPADTARIAEHYVV